MLKRALLILVLSLTPSMAMHQWMVNIGDIDLEARVQMDLAQFNDSYAPDSYYAGVGYLDTDTYQMVYGTYLIIRDVPQKENTRFGFGMKFVNTERNGEVFTASPFGMVYEYAAGDGENPMYAKFEAYYAPGVLSYDGARSYMELRGELVIEPIENMRAFVGYRLIENTYTEGGKHVFNNIPYGGVQVGF